MSERNYPTLLGDMVKASQSDEGVQITENEAKLLIEKLAKSANNLQQQNQRYKQALEFYANKDNYNYHFKENVGALFNRDLD